MSYTTGDIIGTPLADSGAPWAGNTPYTVDNNLFRVTETIPANAVDIDGNEIVQGGLYCYPTVPHTSPATLTVPDLALMKRKGGSSASGIDIISLTSASPVTDLDLGPWVEDGFKRFHITESGLTGSVISSDGVDGVSDIAEYSRDNYIDAVATRIPDNVNGGTKNGWQLTQWSRHLDIAVSGLDSLSAKLHSVIYPASGSLCDVSNQGRGLNPVLGDVTFDPVDGSAIYGDNVRSVVNTESDAATLTIYAMVRYDSARDNDSNISIFINNNTFLPIASPQTNTETIRLDGTSNNVNFSVDGVTNFARRSDVLAAINTGDYVIAKFEDVPSGSVLFIGDHPQNANFHSTVSLKAIVTVEGNPDQSDDLIINHAMRSGIDVEKLSRITSLDTVLANATATAMNNGGGGTGPQFIDYNDPIVITKPDTVLRFEHEANVAQGAAYFTFGTTAGQEIDGVGSLSAATVRLTPTSTEKKIEAVVQPGTYFVRQGAGGGSSVTSSSLKITQICTGSQTPVEPAPEPSALFDYLNSWTKSGGVTVTDSAIAHNGRYPQAVDIEDSNAGGHAFIRLTSDYPNNGDKYARFVFGIDAANTHALLMRLSPANGSTTDFVLSLKTGDWYTTRTGPGEHPDVTSKIIDDGTAVELIVKYSEIQGGVHWTLFTAIGPDDVVGQNWVQSTVGVTQVRELDLNYTPPEMQTDLTQWLTQWERNGSGRAVQQVMENGRVATRISAGLLHTVGNVPSIGEKQSFRVSFLRQPGVNEQFMVRVARSGYAQDFYINVDTGATVATNVGYANPELIDVKVTEHVITVIGTFDGPATGTYDGFYLLADRSNANTAGTEYVDILEFDPNYIAKPDFTTYITDGVEVNAAQPWTGSVIADQGAASTQDIVTGVDLTDVETLVLHYRRADGQWPDTHRVDMSDVTLDSDQGYMVGHFDNDFIAIRINAADITAGVIKFYSAGGVNFEVTEIEFKVKASGVSSRVGNFEWGPTGRTVAEGFLAMVGVVANGAIDYPVAASRNPAFVSGNNFDFAAVDGAFLRNLGTNAAAEGVRQSDLIKAHNHSYVDRWHNSFVGRGTGGNTARSGNVNENKTTGSVGGVETRPVNVAQQLYLIVDSYIEVAQVAASLPAYADDAAAGAAGLVTGQHFQTDGNGAGIAGIQMVKQ